MDTATCSGRSSLENTSKSAVELPQPTRQATASNTEIVLYTTSVATTAKVRTDVQWVLHLLKTKGVAYEEVDLVQEPGRRAAMLEASDGFKLLPQLHVNGKLVGDVSTLQELEDAGMLEGILRGQQQ